MEYGVYDDEGRDLELIDVFDPGILEGYLEEVIDDLQALAEEYGTRYEDLFLATDSDGNYRFSGIPIEDEG